MVEEIKEDGVEVGKNTMEVDMSMDNADIRNRLLSYNVSPKIPERRADKFKIEARDIILKSFLKDDQL